MRILGIAGSLRRGSYNRALLEAARAQAPRSMTIEPFALDDVPLYNADLDADGRRPVAVERLKKAVADAGALLIATPSTTIRSRACCRTRSIGRRAPG